MKNLRKVQPVLIIPVCLVSILIYCSTVDELTPVRVVTELELGESRDITLSNGETVNLTLLEITDMRDSLRNAIRSVDVKVTLDGRKSKSMGGEIVVYDWSFSDGTTAKGATHERSYQVAGE